MKVFDNYHLPATVNEALALLARYEGRARVIAGGTDLLVDTQAEYYEGHRPHFDALVDITRLEGAREIRVEGDSVTIGCGVSHTRIVASPRLRERAAALVEACAVVGGPQVRNVATLVGNVAHALPAADGTVALMALDAEAQVARPSSLQWLPLAALFKGPGVSAVDSTREIITAVRFRLTGAGDASAFARVMRPQGVALPILGMAVKGEFAARGSESEIVRVAICAGPVAPVPFRAVKTEDYLRGKRLTGDVLRSAAAILLDEVAPRTSPHRATKEYRLELLPSLLEQTLSMASARARRT